MGVTSEFTIRLIDASRRLGKSVDCFDFVPSDYETVWSVLSDVRSRFPAEPAPVFCEWGSGLGVVTGMAEILGFQAFGIEIDAALADQSRELMRSCGLTSRIITGSYMTLPHSADVIFVYCWPGRRPETEKHFIDTAPEHALLLICHGASDVRCKTKAQLADDA